MGGSGELRLDPEGRILDLVAAGLSLGLAWLGLVVVAGSVERPSVRD